MELKNTYRWVTPFLTLMEVASFSFMISASIFQVQFIRQSVVGTTESYLGVVSILQELLAYMERWE